MEMAMDKSQRKYNAFSNLEKIIKMKQIFKLLFLLLCFQSCKAQVEETKSIETNIKKDPMIYPIVTKDFETFNNYQYENRKDKNSLYMMEFDEKGGYFNIDKTGESRYFYTPKDSFFSLVKIYYKNGYIKHKGIGLNVAAWGCKFGTWYEFDEQGKLIKEIDYDKDYKFTFEDILKFCEREKIKIDKGPVLQSTGFHTSILRNHSVINQESTWTIEWLKDSGIIQTIKLDGTTGKVLSRRDAMYINN